MLVDIGKDRQCCHNDILFFDIHNFADAHSVTAAFEFGGKEDIDELAGNTDAHDSAAQAKHICIVVKSGIFCAVGVTATAGTDAANLVCGYGNANAGTAEKETFFTFAVCDFFASLNCNIG